MENDTTVPFRLRFEGLTPAQANHHADELEQKLHQITQGELATRRQRENQEGQDLGAVIEILVVLLGTPFAVAIAHGIRDFISKRSSSIVIETEAGKVIAAGDAAKELDAAALAAALKDPKSWAAKPESDKQATDGAKQR